MEGDGQEAGPAGKPWWRREVKFDPWRRVPGPWLRPLFITQIVAMTVGGAAALIASYQRGPHTGWGVVWSVGWGLALSLLYLRPQLRLLRDDSN